MILCAPASTSPRCSPLSAGSPPAGPPRARPSRPASPPPRPPRPRPRAPARPRAARLRRPPAIPPRVPASSPRCCSPTSSRRRPRATCAATTASSTAPRSSSAWCPRPRRIARPTPRRAGASATTIAPSCPSGHVASIILGGLAATETGGTGPTCECEYGCRTDADCPEGQICRCAGDGLGTYTRCIAADCTADADCPGEMCGLAGGACSDGLVHAACTTPQDECDGPSDCGGNLCVIEDARWICNNVDCGRPFIVDAAPVTAPAAARDDWRGLVAVPAGEPALRAACASAGPRSRWPSTRRWPRSQCSSCSSWRSAPRRRW
ncbi:hypothetical protein [Nannocystis pusilla]|uniref:hypothetical protein n=1 Tax=Nannocystis pusilla TaxID=889268 RepID=UPI003B80D3A5